MKIGTFAKVCRLKNCRKKKYSKNDYKIASTHFKFICFLLFKQIKRSTCLTSITFYALPYNRDIYDYHSIPSSTESRLVNWLPISWVLLGAKKVW